MKTLTITSPDGRVTVYDNFEILAEVIFGEFTFIKVVCTGKDVYINPARVGDMTVVEVVNG